MKYVYLSSEIELNVDENLFLKIAHLEISAFDLIFQPP